MDGQAKIPLPQAIFHGFLFVTVKVLNSYDRTYLRRNKTGMMEIRIEFGKDYISWQFTIH